MKISNNRIKQIIKEEIQNNSRNVVDLLELADEVGFKNFVSKSFASNEIESNMLEELTHRFLENGIIKTPNYEVVSIWYAYQYSRPEGVIIVEIHDKNYRDDKTYKFSSVDYGSPKVMSENMFRLTVETMKKYIDIALKQKEEFGQAPSNEEIMNKTLEIVRMNLPQGFKANIEKGKFNYENGSTKPSDNLIIRYDDNSYCGNISIRKDAIDYLFGYGCPLGGSTTFNISLNELENAVRKAIAYICR